MRECVFLVNLLYHYCLAYHVIIKNPGTERRRIVTKQSPRLGGRTPTLRAALHGFSSGGGA